MDAQDAIDLGRQAMFTALLVGSPALLVGMAAGLIIGLLQALTQVQDQTVSFVPKILAMIAALALALPWLLQTMMDYCVGAFAEAPKMILGN